MRPIDVMDWLRKQLHQEKLPMGSVLTWTVCRKNVLVNEVTFDDGMAGL